MQTYWLPFGNLEILGQSTTANTDPQNRQHGFATALSKLLEEKKRQSESLIEQPTSNKLQPNDRSLVKTSTTKNNLTAQNAIGQVSDSESLNKDRKRPSTLTEEPARKQFKFQIPNNDGGKTEADKNNAQSKLENTALKNKRCLSGNVKQILKLNKDFPGLDGFYEVYANVFRIDNSIARQKTLLLRNETGTGPIMQGVFYEIDIQMVEVKVGDAVRCVGKFVNNSRLHIFKLSLVTENNKQLVPRLFSLASFVLGKK